MIAGYEPVHPAAVRVSDLVDQIVQVALRAYGAQQTLDVLTAVHSVDTARLTDLEAQLRTAKEEGQRLRDALQRVILRGSDK